MRMNWLSNRWSRMGQKEIFLVHSPHPLPLVTLVCFLWSGTLTLYCKSTVLQFLKRETFFSFVFWMGDICRFTLWWERECRKERVKNKHQRGRWRWRTRKGMKMARNINTEGKEPVWRTDLRSWEENKSTKKQGLLTVKWVESRVVLYLCRMRGSFT